MNAAASAEASSKLQKNLKKKVAVRDRSSDGNPASELTYFLAFMAFFMVFLAGAASAGAWAFIAFFMAAFFMAAIVQSSECRSGFTRRLELSLGASKKQIGGDTRKATQSDTTGQALL